MFRIAQILFYALVFLVSILNVWYFFLPELSIINIVANLLLLPCIMLLGFTVLFVQNLKLNPVFHSLALFCSTCVWLMYNFPINEKLEQSEASNLKMIVCNIHQFENDTSMAMAAAQAIRLANPDIACLQEFGLYYKWPNTQAVAEDFAKQTGFPYFDFSPQKDNIFGTAIFSKYPILSIDTIFQLHSHTNEAKSYSILKNSDTFNLINVHLQSFNLKKIEDENQPTLSNVLGIQHEQLKQVINHAKRRKTIICGDFNFLPHSFHYQQVEQNGFMDVQTKAGQAWNPTYPFILSRLDYIFVNPNVRVSKYHLIEFGGSDHMALFAEISL